ncbi:uncharacterized protein PV06_05236 [Exophiala oligosperma]|uniref:Myb-like domain-containing protein n=2 Tax=Chaetothyriales TaxID=34395 RepID=A0A0D2E8K7_9EURO|nr:uncharacterized protein PV06_05236 [Exophiala oligosperma]KAJ9644255.1 hypothetical protein H2204_001606 [Knufia peltigerae]KIW44209.1 hypothetical protein PV06_05236 [Exophiala oligosperma]
MPYHWTAERERRMLLLAIASAKLKPSAGTWTKVAQLLGEGLTASAVSQKYYKLRNEFGKQLDGQPSSSSSMPSTPTKRKARDNDDNDDYDDGEGTEDKKPRTPSSKRAKKPKWEPLDAILVSDSSDDGSASVKEEDMTANMMNTTTRTNMFEQQYMNGQLFMPVHMPVATKENSQRVY